jgi:hypothetical protein
VVLAGLGKIKRPYLKNNYSKKCWIYGQSMTTDVEYASREIVTCRKIYLGCFGVDSRKKYL